jgi:hypothetical protein
MVMVCRLELASALKISVCAWAAPATRSIAQNAMPLPSRERRLLLERCSIVLASTSCFGPKNRKRLQSVSPTILRAPWFSTIHSAWQATGCYVARLKRHFDRAQQRGESFGRPVSLANSIDQTALVNASERAGQLGEFDWP